MTMRFTGCYELFQEMGHKRVASAGNRQRSSFGAMGLQLLLGFFILQACAPWVRGAEVGVAAQGPEFNAVPDLPAFITAARTFRVVINDTVVLPCEVTNPGSYVLVWKRGIAVLTAGATKVSPDERLRLVDGYNLEIRDVATSDAGDYVCQIGTMEPKEITHTVEILVPPRIHQVTSNGELDVKKGATVTLECRASGNPVPNITWTRKNNLLPTGEKTVQGFSITIEQTTRHHAGIYECTASNGVGEPVTRRINLHVQFSPEIEVEKSWVHSGEGYEAQLVCIVHAEPPAEVLWFRNTLRLETSERHIMEVRGSRHTLIIRKVQGGDFGNYSCVADNSLGKARQHLQLSGVPNTAEFISSAQGHYAERYNLTWSVVSFSPIEEFKLSFRKMPRPPAHGEKLQPQPQSNPKIAGRREHDPFAVVGFGGARMGEWSEVVLSTPPSEQPSQTMSYMIHGLEPGMHYEATVQAKNRFGWNNVSRRFHFSTRNTELEVRDMGVIAAGKMNAANAAPAPAAPAAALAAAAGALLLLLTALAPGGAPERAERPARSPGLARKSVENGLSVWSSSEHLSRLLQEIPHEQSIAYDICDT